MNEVIRVPKFFRGLLAICLLGFLVFLSFTVYAVKGQIYLICIFSAFWGLFIVGTLYALLQCWRWSLTVRGDSLVEQGIIRRREIKLRDAASIRWHASPKGGKIVLRSTSQKISLPLELLDLGQRRRLIYLLRTSLPESIQHGWDRFCFQNAFPLLQSRPEWPVVKNNYYPTRRQLDLCFAPFLLIVMVLCVLYEWQFQTTTDRTLPLSLAVMWPLLRFQIPKNRASSSNPQGLILILFSLCWSLVAMLGYAAYYTWGRDVAYGSLWGTLGLIAWMALFVDQFRRVGRCRRREEEPLVQFAVREWDRIMKNDPSIRA
jgi:hypothetical protein